MGNKKTLTAICENCSEKIKIVKWDDGVPHIETKHDCPKKVAGQRRITVFIPSVGAIHAIMVPEKEAEA